VTAAERTARAKGASGVGLIVSTGFRITPAPPGGAYVLYAGAYRAQGPAQRALAKLAARFPGAKVIRVQAAGAASATAGAGRVLARTA
jgi:hypothetical protein